jgi:hypothetical protein
VTRPRCEPGGTCSKCCSPRSVIFRGLQRAALPPPFGPLYNDHVGYCFLQIVPGVPLMRRRMLPLRWRRLLGSSPLATHEVHLIGQIQARQTRILPPRSYQACVHPVHSSWFTLYPMACLSGMRFLTATSKHNNKQTTTNHALHGGRAIVRLRSCFSAGTLKQTTVEQARCGGRCRGGRGVDRKRRILNRGCNLL